MKFKIDNIKKRVFSGVLAVMLVSISIVSCGEGGLAGTGLNLFAVSDDRALGDELHQQILNDPQQFPIYNNNYAESYVQGMVDRIIQSPQVQYEEEFAYDVTLIDDPTVVNAFVTPGGYIYVYTGLLKFMPNEAALAGVLAHEVAHAEERHATQRMTTAYGLSTLLSIVLGENPGQIEAIAADLLGGLYLLKHSRSDELESDERSFQYLTDTEYYPAAMEFFFEELGDGDAEFSFEQLFLTHPDPDIRLEEIREMARQAGVTPTPGNTFTSRYQDFLSQID